MSRARHVQDNRMTNCWPLCIAGALLLLASGTKGNIPDGGQCIWYGPGHQNPDKEDGLLLNRIYDGPAIELVDTMAIQSMDIHCPLLMEEIRGLYNGSIYTCCDAANILDMTSNFLLLDSFLEKCPACKTNIKKNFCYFTCHPRHSNFLIPTKVYESPDEDPDDVWSLDYYITEDYTNTTFTSCSEVYAVEVNMPALSLLCGPYGDKCDHEKLFTYFGNNNFAPFNITYQWTDGPEDAEDATTGLTRSMTPFDMPTFPCNSTDPTMHCLCTDCRASCPVIPDLVPDKEWPMIGGMDAFAFALVLFFIVMVVPLIIVTAACCWDRDNEDECGCSCSCSQTISAGMERGIKSLFTAIGTFVAKHPFLFLYLGVALIIGLSIGVKYLEVTTDPVELWASPSSRTRKDKDYFDTNFNPFYRTTQVIIKAKGYEWFNVTLTDYDTETDYMFGPALNESFMLRVMALQNEITSLTGEFNGQAIRLTDVCEKPMAPQYDECLIQSVLNYWQNDISKLNSSIESGKYASDFVDCVSNPTNVDEPYCMGSYGGPVFPYTALGGFLDDGDIISSNPSYTESIALIINILITNYADKSKLGPALAWEKRFIDFMKERTMDPEIFDHMDIAFNAERGIEDELKRESVNDVVTIFISYLIMFAYITIALGNLSTDCSRIFIESKMFLALGGVTLVMLSVVSSLGFYGYVGVPATLFVIEVIPFLVLAVGVDNIFILVQTWQREPRREDETLEEHIGRVVGIVAPSMLLSTTAEALCFFLGGLSDMPAVYAFAMYAGLALVIDFFLQMTCFVAFMALDGHRVEGNRYDICCDFRGAKKKQGTTDDNTACYNIFKDVYAPFILKDFMRVIVCLVFTALFCVSLAYTPHIDVGLEQELSMPKDSFVLKWFQYLNKYLSVGAPVYFVMKEGYNFTDPHEQNLVCQVGGCSDDSIMQQIFISSLEPEQTYLASGGMSWLGPYFTWLSDSINSELTITACCRLDAAGNFVNSSANVDFNGVATCFRPPDFISGRPKPELFMKHLQDFLNDNPHDKSCPSAGHPAYGQAVKILKDEDGEEYVGATYYMAYHTILRTSEDFINAMDYAYRLTDLMTKYLRANSTYSPDLEVFPYSIFYVYYEQYLTMWKDTGISLGISVGSVFLVTLVLTCDLTSSCIILVTIVMIVVDIMGMMQWWDISLNAVTLVNLVMAVGISVEFCSHITHAFATSVQLTRIERAQEALSTMGSSVLSGITLTKFGGIFVLGFAQSQIFRVFYFRMYLGMVIFGASHGLMFLPVFLSICGPPVNQALLSRKRKKEEQINLRELQQQQQAAQKQQKTEAQLQQQISMNQKLQQQLLEANQRNQTPLVINYNAPAGNVYPNVVGFSNEGYSGQ